MRGGEEMAPQQQGLRGVQWAWVAPEKQRPQSAPQSPRRCALGADWGGAPVGNERGGLAVESLAVLVMILLFSKVSYVFQHFYN